MTEIEYKEWANEVPFLAAMPKKMPFTVPAGYFDRAEGEMLTQMALTGFHGLQHSGFTVPENYFEFLPEQILSKIRSEEFRAAGTGFKLPEGYFNKLTANILDRTVNEERTVIEERPAKIFKLWNSDLMRYASAACVVLICAAMLFFNQQQYRLDTTSTADLHSTEQMLYGIDEEVIIEHLEAADQQSVVPEAQLEEYILENYSSNELTNGL